MGGGETVPLCILSLPLCASIASTFGWNDEKMWCNRAKRIRDAEGGVSLSRSSLICLASACLRMEARIVGGKSFGKGGSGQNTIRAKKDGSGKSGGDALSVKGKGSGELKGVVSAQRVDSYQKHGLVEKRCVRWK
jgi:hypothetical protein